jgi:hypothetical protein
VESLVGRSTAVDDGSTAERGGDLTAAAADVVAAVESFVPPNADLPCCCEVFKPSRSRIRLIQPLVAMDSA